MSAAATQAPVREVVNTRRVPRFPLAVPADVTVLRSGIPYSIPGRSVSIGERGLGVVLAGEVHAGDSVGLEFRLPDSGGRLRLKAVVRYQALLHCGLEFLNLTAEQQTLIEHWTRKKSGFSPIPRPPVVNDEPVAPPSVGVPAPPPSAPKPKTRRGRMLWFVLAGMLLLGGLIWWQWRRAWNELESQVPATRALGEQAQAVVPAEIMEGRVIHKVDPIYPEAARQANIHGVVVLDTVVGADGAVIDVRTVSGPDELAAAAADALKWWRFQPYVVNGQAVQVKTRLAVEFRGN